MENKNNAIKYILALVLLFSITCVIAQPPFQQSPADVGIVIESPVIEYHIASQTFKFHAHAHNASDGLLLKNDTTNCIMHLYCLIDGSHSVEDNMTFDTNDVDFEYVVDGNNFTRAGQYAVLFYCEVPNDIGGFFEYVFDVTPNGQFLYEGTSIIYSLFSLILFGILCIISFFLIVLPYENEKDEGGFETKIVRIKYLRPILMVILYLTTVILLNFLNGIAVNFSTLSMFSGTLGFLFEIMMRMAWPFTIIMIVWIVYMLIKDTNVSKNLDKFVDIDPFTK